MMEALGFLTLFLSKVKWPTQVCNKKRCDVHTLGESFHQLQKIMCCPGVGKPVKVKFSQGNQQKRACFSASLEDRHKTDDGSEYLHFIFGSQKDKNPECSNLGVLDAEFIFLASRFSNLSSYNFLISVTESL